ncbi:TPA: fimbrial protein [Burkholderia cepacia]|uniref:Fimbrial protein (Pilin) n=1 Tax=Medicago truncatula TaxID=3880 RepID=A0A072TNU9_MEDTR|nr:fimbrial protein [Burkholderia cepacia]KEH15250.1 fimbrial protein (pilin) [Medicago truncatula]HDR9756897.1 type 1 fimbrial protein [Burkholderia cepacia ATCC 25416]KVS34367.1 fimbrial protein [Burkholderia cepacia]MBY4709234.1 type 1 fimbrial protein [Burkholderia cepacia]MBY4736301.1 type 1 fimbrial protein [Burkholderia cepacia]
MKINSIPGVLSSLLIVAGIAISSNAHAVDGTVSFAGQVISSTCKVEGQSNDLSVTLPPVSTAALGSVGTVAGRTPFALSLTGCTTGDGNPVKVGVLFEPGANVDQSTGRLTADTGAGKAEGVQLNVLDAQQKHIPVGSQSPANTQMVDIDANGAAKLAYFAEYYAADAVKAGNVTSRVEYSLIYQ